MSKSNLNLKTYFISFQYCEVHQPTFLTSCQKDGVSNAASSCLFPRNGVAGETKTSPQFDVPFAGSSQLFLHRDEGSQNFDLSVAQSSKFVPSGSPSVLLPGVRRNSKPIFDLSPAESSPQIIGKLEFSPVESFKPQLVPMPKTQVNRTNAKVKNANDPNFKKAPSFPSYQDFELEHQPKPESKFFCEALDRLDKLDAVLEVSDEEDADYSFKEDAEKAQSIPSKNGSKSTSKETLVPPPLPGVRSKQKLFEKRQRSRLQSSRRGSKLSYISSSSSSARPPAIFVHNVADHQLSRLFGSDDNDIFDRLRGKLEQEHSGMMSHAQDSVLKRPQNIDGVHMCSQSLDFGASDDDDFLSHRFGVARPYMYNRPRALRNNMAAMSRGNSSGCSFVIQTVNNEEYTLQIADTESSGEYIMGRAIEESPVRESDSFDIIIFFLVGPVKTKHFERNGLRVTSKKNFTFFENVYFFLFEVPDQKTILKNSNFVILYCSVFSLSHFFFKMHQHFIFLGWKDVGPP